mgnify:CR=1 FL=1
MRWGICWLNSSHIYYPCGYSSNVGMLHCFPSLTRTLLSYRDIRQNGFHSETYADKKEKYILFTICNGYGKHILYVSSGLYYTYYKTRSTCCAQDSFPKCLVHEKLGIPALVIETLGWNRNYQQFHWFMIVMMLNSNNIWILCALQVTQGS